MRQKDASKKAFSYRYHFSFDFGSSYQFVSGI